MLRALPAVTAVVAIVAAGVVHGFWTERWGLSQEVATAAANLDRIPMRFGDWQGQPVDTDIVDDQGLAGQLYRRYVNRKTGDAVTVALVCGRPGPTLIHTPDVCYEASGYEVGRKATIDLPGPKIEARFFVADAVHTSAADQTKVRIFWAWYAGARWDVAENPRFAFRGPPSKVRYKFYVARELTVPVDPEQDPCLEFLRQILPELGPYLVPAGGG